MRTSTYTFPINEKLNDRVVALREAALAMENPTRLKLAKLIMDSGFDAYIGGSFVSAHIGDDIEVLEISDFGIE